ncbi:MAG: glycerol-3-phosphate acyltransferase [Anaerolinea sp.]|mgnify:CR=1 FL=1|nr:glycerol-3-phosphate acyltransferase [Anaerolinea sp.]MCC6973950.1 glycerol-3-phosphate acyltransferase [Anaerolineae bacterium]
MNVVIAVLIAYLLGAVPTAYVVGRLNGINIFAVGSGNMGATNVTRALGPQWGAVVMIVDLIKGALGVLIARALNPGEDLIIATFASGVAVIVGHNWSLFATLLTGKIRGGKGAATTAGGWIVIFGHWPYLIFGPALLFIAVVISTKYVSLSVLMTGVIGAVGAVLAAFSGVIPDWYALYAVIAALLLLYRHRENIDRLRKGTERRLGERIKS